MPQGEEFPFLAGGGVSGALARSVDWAGTPLGPPASWPQSLRTIVSMILHSRHPMFLWWGPELIQLYNDAYLPSFGAGKHPAAMGQRGRDCWQEIWPIIGPQIEAVLAGRSTWNEDHLVPIFRNGRIEEVYWTYGYSPVMNEADAVGGVLVVCTETTSRVIAERRSRTMRALVERTAMAMEPAAMMEEALEVLAQARADIPFALTYRFDRQGGRFDLSHGVGLADVGAADAVVRGWLTPALFEGSGPRVFPCDGGLPGGPWPEPCASVFVAPLAASPSERPSGLIVFGLSPRLPFDEGYRNHLEQIAAHLALGQARINAFRTRAAAQDERERLLVELEAASRAKDEFLAMLGHELRNPLSPIATALQLMRLKRAGDTTKEQQIIERHVNHLTRLVDDLLDVSRITRGKVELRRELVEVADVVGKALEMAGDLFEQRKQQVTVELGTQPLRTDGDPVRLAQVVANLLTNAARYTEPGGRIRVSAAREGAEVVIRVNDSGAGISSDLLPRIFDLFVQGNRSTDRAQGGLGLGLALVKNLVALHGGRVEASSAGAGQGSEFVIWLPAAEAPASASSAALAAVRAPAAGRAARRRVLVVDDNTDAADLLGELLRAEGHEVAVAYTAAGALAAVEGFRPEVAVLDIGLPVMDGYELAAHLRANRSTAACRLIALTGYGQQHDRARSESSGFTHHLVKPVDIDTLTRLVDHPG